jgi:hypothetical protein
MSKLKLRLTVDVEYDLNGTPPGDLKDYLGELPRAAAGDGLFTGFTDAEVENWSSTVEEIL